MNQQTKFKQTEIGMIPEDWELIKLKNYLKISPRNGVYKGKEDQGKGIDIVKMGTLFSSFFIDDQDMEKFELDQKEKRIFLLEKDDLVFARTSLILEGVGKCAIVDTDSREIAFESNTFRIRLDNNKINPKYILYFFRSRVGRHFIDAIASQTAATSIKSSDLVNISLPIPKKSEQDKVAQVLYNLDTRIKILKQMNKTLEAIGQALFKHWFVDFEFPNEEGKPYKSSGREMIDSELGEIPKGWGAGRLGEFINITSGKRPEQKSEVKDSVFNVPLVGASRVMGFVMEPLFKEPVLIIGRVGTHGVVQRFTTPTYPSDNTLVIRSPFYEYVYQVLKRIDYASLNVGSTQPLITQSSIKNYSIIISEKHIRINFENTVSVLFAKRNANNLEIENLSQIRDTLHPKLMSGEVRINK